MTESAQQQPAEGGRASTGARGPTGEAGPGRAPDPLFGKVIADRYRIVGHVGRGGMGVVYKVEHLRIGKLMAMKLLTGELSRNRDVVRRFKREALAASRLTSVNTVQVWDFGHSEGLTYLVMELVDGEDFGKVLKAHGPMGFQRVAKIAVQVCNSLIEAHARGIVHRDLKPENLLLVETGSNDLQDLVKVLDFGLAKLHEDDTRPNANPNDITTTGAIVGTPYYMAPEQIRGEPVDGRTDVYALGAVIYRALTGKPPFEAPSPMAVLTAHLTEPLIPPHERAPELGIPFEASEIVAMAMAKDREDRPASAAALRELLIAHLAKSGVSGGFLRSGSLEVVAAHGTADAAHAESVPPVDAPARAATRLEVDAYARRMRRNGAIAAVIGAALVGLALWVVNGWRQGTTPAKHAANEEQEPNDDIVHALPLPIGSPIQGYLGKRIGPDVGDVDVYAVDVASSAGDRPLLEIDLGPLPNFPLCLELFDAEGAPPLGTFCRPRARALHVDAFAIAPGHHYLRVFQDRAAAAAGERTPVYENVSDTYSLRVALASRRPDLEIEPNDTVASAMSVPAGVSIGARLGWKGDEDVFCAAPGSGSARFVVSDRGGSGRGARLQVAAILDGARGPATTLGGAPANGANGANGKAGDPAGGGPAASDTYTGGAFPLAGAHSCVSVRAMRATGAVEATTTASDDAPYQVTLEAQ